ncbi:hypothetical protein BFP70_10745 [Thioclava sp. SK-1]|uniref:efflux RND transporter periplasmic adaptor subunit n=1 Tax=Thioclava sp. SK-1 TaxID=1889770 RepID=UPI000824144D|nr:HlyD family efflux transporter periplasmic adaptor subunit [Thioclava sp. SK-1]OCX64510.1 hypothetical protein BFP70_10745 [Thioclava sp. SK-1]
MTQPTAPAENAQIIRALADFSGTAAQFWHNFCTAGRHLSGAEQVAVMWSPLGNDRAQWSTLDSLPKGAVLPPPSDTVMQQMHRDGVAQAQTPGGQIIMCRIQVEDETQQVALIAQFGQAQANIQQAMVRLNALCAVPLAFEMGRKTRQAGRDGARLALTLELLGKVLDCDTFDRAALALANGLSEQFACESVSVVWHAREGMRLRAISHAERLERRTEASALVEEAAQEALTQGVEVTWPNTDRAVAHAQGRYAALVQPGHLITLPMIETLPDGTTRPLGAVVLERQSRGFSAAEHWALRLHCEMVQAPLSWLHRDTRWLPVRLWRAVVPSIPAQLRPSSGAGRRLLAGAVAAVIGVLCVPIPFNISATAVLKADQMAFIGAPFDGYIANSRIILGDTVTQDDPLFQMADQELTLERSTLLAELAQANRDAEIRRSMGQLSEMQIAQAKAEEVKAKLIQIDQRLASATALAPIDGVVVDGEPAKKIGEAVRRGEPLVTLAALGSLYVEAAVSERDLSYIIPGQPARLTLLAQPQDSYGFTVDRIIPAPSVQDAQNVFPIRFGQMVPGAPDAGWWLPGMTGVAKISAGRRPIGWIATRQIADYLRLLLWY